MSDKKEDQKIIRADLSANGRPQIQAGDNGRPDGTIKNVLPPPPPPKKKS